MGRLQCQHLEVGRGGGIEVAAALRGGSDRQPFGHRGVDARAHGGQLLAVRCVLGAQRGQCFPRQCGVGELTAPLRPCRRVELPALEGRDAGRRPRRAGPAPAAPLRAAGPEFSSSTVSNQLEHAALLAGAGEIDAVIHVLRGEQAARPSDAGVRSALADLHYRRAEQLQSRDRAAALQSLADCLALEPQHAPARQLQMRLRSTRPAGR